MSASTTPAIVVQSGPLRGQTFPLSLQQPFLIGRHSWCHITFPADHAHRMVGRIHAIIHRRATGVFILNAHERNLVFVNQASMGQWAESVIAETDTITIGEDGPRLCLGLMPAANPLPLPSPGPAAATQLFRIFSRQLLTLNERLQDSSDGMVAAQKVLDDLELVVPFLPT